VRKNPQFSARYRGVLVPTASDIMIVSLMLIALQTVLAHVSVAQGAGSLIEEPREVVVRSTQEWQALWKEHSPQDAPRVDFNGAIVVGVFLGTRPTAGYRVQIEAVRLDGAKAVVEYRERAPGRGDIVAQILTAPFDLVRVVGRPANVEFRRLQ
jgi:hypothetical protein